MTPNDAPSRASARLGWTLLGLFMAGGLVLEALHGIKAPWYLDHALTRELLVLAHAHGALLALVNLAFASQALALVPDARRRRLAGAMLRWGAILMPAGFFLGAVGAGETDPSLGILLTPIGALLLLHGVTVMALGAWRGPAAPPAASGGLPPVRKARSGE
jgi:hypothetical protein